MAKAEKPEEFAAPDVLESQPCPICSANALTLTESEREIPFFGKVYLFSMTCTACKYHKADLEAAETKDPCKYSIEIKGKDDLNIRIVKSAEAVVKIPHMMTIESGPSSQGYITNVEGLLMRVKGVLESAKENAEDAGEQDQARKHLKKLNRVLWGEDLLKIIIEDPTGNSAIISQKAQKSRLK
ncbi:ZPR1 zinc finger domain-containing protein [Candidatus Woesearchaeota archaeon]|nr:ZPR1 zinc finger domain-containing protein [Candidatus Woesearchaeota archaeon]